MLKKSLDKKLFLLNVCFYLIISVVTVVGGYKISSAYNAVSNITADQISKWLNQANNSDYTIDVKKVQLEWRGINIYLVLNDISITDDFSKLSIISPAHKNLKKNNNRHHVAKAQEITGRINILSAILFGKIKMNNFIVKEIDFTANSIYPLQKISQINGNMVVDVNFFSKTVEKPLHITAKFIIDNIDFDIHIDLNITPNSIQLINFKLENTSNSIRDVIKYLPEYFVNKRLLQWLNSALLSGSIKSSELFLDENNKFTWKIKFKDLNLKYASGWPIIQKLSATMEITDDKLHIYMDAGSNKGFILNQPIKELSAGLTGMSLDITPPLLIKAEIVSSADKGLEFLKKTGLSKNMDLNSLSTDGKINLSLNLLIPTNNFFNTEESIKYSGNCELVKVNAKLSNVNLAIIDLVGNIKFANDYFAASDLQAKVFDIPIQANFVLDNKYLLLHSSLFDAKLSFKNNNNFNLATSKNIEIIFEELLLFDNVFKNIRFVNYASDNTLSFESDKAQGSVSYNDVNSGKYYINFDKLKINKDNNLIIDNKASSLLSAINEIRFNCENFYLNDLNLGKISFNFIKDIKSGHGNKHIIIDIAQLHNQDINIDAKGSWQIKDLKHYQTNINGKLYSKNFGDAFKRLNINSKFMQAGNGTINFDLQWLNDPFTFNLNHMVGHFNLDIKSGIIVGVEPGLGRIIGLFSLENIQRRLQLDFSDVTKGGFSFDKLNGRLDINQGQVLFNNIIINGPSANLIINGNTSLVSKTLDLSMEVTSKAGATLPLAAAIAAGNPVIGAALWLFDHASGAKVSEFHAQKYKVSGTWEKPEINQI